MMNPICHLPGLAAVDTVGARFIAPSKAIGRGESRPYRFMGSNLDYF
ncbi:MAG: hypothetical protein IT210_04885 [Armatimonadetes bacterium]|nr:hypothetical protein [Armatimonadota bacterium]